MLGIIQGISEILPISSSAHLIIFSKMLNIPQDDLTLEVFLHLASLIAVLFFMRKTIKKMITGSYMYIIKKEKQYYHEFMLLLNMIISTLPIVIVTIILGKYVDFISSNIILIGFLLIINGILITAYKGKEKKQEITLKDALVIGLFQCIGILPGISRSGSCLLGGKNREIEKGVMAEYAFLLFIPAALGATILKIKNITKLIYSKEIIMYMIVFMVTAIVTYLSLCLLLKLIKNGKIKIFSIYCILIGLMIVIFNL